MVMVLELSVLKLMGRRQICKMEIFWSSPPFYIAGCRDKKLASKVSLTISILGHWFSFPKIDSILKIIFRNGWIQKLPD